MTRITKLSAHHVFYIGDGLELDSSWELVPAKSLDSVVARYLGDGRVWWMDEPEPIFRIQKDD